jgi:hypothetical protein
MDVKRACVLFVAVAAGTVGCAQVLGLDAGMPEDADGSAEEGAEGNPPSLEAGYGHTLPPEEATSPADDDAIDGVPASEADDAQAMSDAAPRSDAAHGSEEASGGDATPHADAAPRPDGAPGPDAAHGPDAAPESEAGSEHDAAHSDAPACLEPLRPCQLSSECCSGTCTLDLTCL